MVQGFYMDVSFINLENHMQLVFEAVSAPRPGPKWQTLFRRHWPAYRAWYLNRRGPNNTDYSKADPAIAMRQGLHTMRTALQSAGYAFSPRLSAWFDAVERGERIAWETLGAVFSAFRPPIRYFTQASSRP